MSIRLQIIIAVFIIGALVVIVNMIRKKRLELRYALAWLLVGIGVLDCFPSLIDWIAQKLGIVNPVNMLFFLGFCFSLIIIFVLTISVSRTSIRIKQLTQELALFEKQEDVKKKNEY